MASAQGRHDDGVPVREPPKHGPHYRKVMAEVDGAGDQVGKRHTSNYVTKLQLADVLAVRKRRAEGEPMADIHKDYPYGARSTLFRAISRTTWKGV